MATTSVETLNLKRSQGGLVGRPPSARTGRHGSRIPKGLLLSGLPFLVQLVAVVALRLREHKCKDPTHLQVGLDHDRLVRQVRAKALAARPEDEVIVEGLFLVSQKFHPLG